MVNKLKILNLFCGIGGNRTCWENAEITAIERNPVIGDIYQARFPKDKIIITDAIAWVDNHQRELLEYDLIWASPPCITHTCMYKRSKPLKREIPDLTSLYGLIILFSKKLEVKWIVENVQPWYSALIQPRVVLERHWLWSNFSIRSRKFNLNRPGRKPIQKLSLEELKEYHAIEAHIDFSNMSYKQTEKILRNCVHRELGKYILEEASNDKNLFDYMNISSMETKEVSLRER